MNQTTLPSTVAITLAGSSRLAFRCVARVAKEHSVDACEPTMEEEDDLEEGLEEEELRHDAASTHVQSYRVLIVASY